MTIYAAPIIANPPIVMDHESHSLLIWSGIVELDYRDIVPQPKPGQWLSDDLEFRLANLPTTKWDPKKPFSAAVSAWPSSFDVEADTGKTSHFGWAIDGTSVDFVPQSGLADISIKVASKIPESLVLRVGYQLMMSR